MRFPTLTQRLEWALIEDGAFNDLTTSRLPGLSRARLKGLFIAKAPGVFCGGRLLGPIFQRLHRGAKVIARVRDGESIIKGKILAEVVGPASAVLGGERLALNLICHLSGVATLTRRFVKAVQGSGAVITDTRKTAPLWRDLERLAVRSGGGVNHRFSLSDAVLAKDNHLAYLRRERISASTIFAKAERTRSGKFPLFIEMEATTLPQVWDAVKARCDIILLDNMPSNRIKEAVALVRTARAAMGTSAPLIEVSGGMTPSRARAAARLGVDRISVGALTHSAPALDISLEVS